MSFLVTARRSARYLLLAVFFAQPLSAAETSLDNLEAELGDLIYRVSRSIVTVEFSDGTGSDETLARVVASGIVADSGGHILVSATAVGNRKAVTVIFGSQRLPARVLGIDYQNMVALLSTGRAVGSPVRFSEDHSCAGQMVVAVGNAYGVRASPTIGFCAGVRDDGNLQFTVPVTSGALGGGVFDLSGSLLGLIAGSIDRRSPVTVAVPAFLLKSTADYLLVNGDRYAGFFGIATEGVLISPPVSLDVSASLVHALSSVADPLDAGVRITSVLTGSPADRAGLRPGDIVFAVGDRRIRSASELSRLVRRLEQGMTVNVEILRLNNQYSVPLIVGKRWSDRQSNAHKPESSITGGRRVVVDSLSRALERFRREVTELEHRLNGID